MSDPSAAEPRGDVPAGDVPAGGGGPAPEDPLAADRRTLTIGAVSMVGLVLVGVVSAQLFNQGGCADLSAPRPAATAVTDDVDGALGGSVTAAELTEVLGGPVTAAAPVVDATALLATADGWVATGTTATALDADLAPTVSVEGVGAVVGGGDTLFHLDLPNAITGQVDALTPITADGLETRGACVDTTVVGAAFAFLLDAGADELLLFRAAEDGGDGVAQLRDADDGAVWDRPWEVPSGPVGTLAERSSGVLGDEVAVTARRAATDDLGGPAVEVSDRGDGEVLADWTLDQLAAAADVATDVPVRVEVLAVSTDTALLTLRPDPADAVDPVAPTALLEASWSDGELRPLGASDDPVRVATATGDGGFVALAGPAAPTAGDEPAPDATSTLLVVDGGSLTATEPLAGAPVAVVGGPDGTWVATDRAVAAVGGASLELADGAAVLDLAVSDGGSPALLLRVGDDPVVVGG